MLGISYIKGKVKEEFEDNDVKLDYIVTGLATITILVLIIIII